MNKTLNKKTLSEERRVPAHGGSVHGELTQRLADGHLRKASQLMVATERGDGATGKTLPSRAAPPATPPHMLHESRHQVSPVKLGEPDWATALTVPSFAS